MPIPDEDIVRRALEKDGRGVLCRQVIVDAWERVKQKHPDLAWWRRRATRANVMWENTTQGAIDKLSGLKGIKHVPHYDTGSWIFDDLVLARFKVASVSLHTSNYPTPLALSFHQHNRDLFGFTDHHRVEFVHVLNRFGTALEWIGVVARQQKRVLWQFELPESAAATPVQRLPLVPKTPAADRVLIPVKPSGEETDKKGE
jgi:hypothetical protein